MEKCLTLINTDNVKFTRECELYPHNPMVLYELYIRVENEDQDITIWGKVAEELGLEFMDRDEWFWDEHPGVKWDKWFKMIDDNGNYDD